MKKYLQALFTIYNARKIGDGFITTVDVARKMGSVQENIRGALVDFARRKHLIKLRDGHNCIWKITPAGIRYLHLKGVISDHEMEQAILEMEKVRW